MYDSLHNLSFSNPSGIVYTLAAGDKFNRPCLVTQKVSDIIS